MAQTAGSNRANPTSPPVYFWSHNAKQWLRPSLLLPNQNQREVIQRKKLKNGLQLYIQGKKPVVGLGLGLGSMRIRLRKKNSYINNPMQSGREPSLGNRPL